MIVLLLLTAPSASAQSTLPVPAAAPLPLLPDARQREMSSCAKETLAKYPKISTQHRQLACEERWRKAVATAAIADAVLAAVPVSASDRVSPADLKARIPALRLGAAKASQGRQPAITGGRLGAVEVFATGNPVIAELSFGFSQPGVDLPWDIATALRARGARVQDMGCAHFGATEANRAFIITAPGRAPFAVRVHERPAALANQPAIQSISVALDGKLPTPASLRAQFPDPAWKAACPT